MKIALILIALVLAGIRINGITHIAFQAVAHLYVGGMLGAWFVGRDRKPLLIAIGLSVVEIICFLLKLGH